MSDSQKSNPYINMDNDILIGIISGTREIIQSGDLTGEWVAPRNQCLQILAWANEALAQRTVSLLFDPTPLTEAQRQHGTIVAMQARIDELEAENRKLQSDLFIETMAYQGYREVHESGVDEVTAENERLHNALQEIRRTQNAMLMVEDKLRKIRQIWANALADEAVQE